jgi:UDP-glucuronate 4-epimerase
MILITGIAGFIGFHLAQKLALDGFDIIGVDNFNDYYDISLKRARAEILIQKGIKILEEDISNELFTKSLFKNYTISHVVNLAAQAGVRYSLTHPRSYLKPNIYGFVNLLEGCKDKKIPFIYASSSSVYGCNTKVPFSEEDRCDIPSNLYGATKKTNEIIAYAYHHLWQIPVTGLRFFTVYGPFGRPDMAYFTFTKSLYEGLEIPLYNNGNMKRDFTFISDIVDGIIGALKLSAPLEIFNLGNNNPHSLIKFVNTLEVLTDKKAKLKYMPMQKGDMQETFASIEHANEKLNFSPKTSLEEGLGLFIDWYRSYYGKN